MNHLLRLGRAWRAEVLGACVAALVALLLVGLAYSAAWPLSLALGQQDARFIWGFHGPEQLDSMSGRWSTAAGGLALPRPPAGPALLTLRLHGGRPPELPDPQVRLDVDGQPLGAFTVLRRIDGARLYHLLVPPTARLDWALRVAITAESFSPPGDPRSLGVVVGRADLAPVAPARWPPPYTALCAAALGALAYAFVRLAGGRQGAALILAATAAALVAWGVATRPLEVLPYLQILATLPALGCAGLLLTRALLPVSPAPANAPGTPTVAGAALPVMLALAWWLAQAFQVLRDRDGAQGLHPAAIAVWAGAALGTGLVAVALWGRLRWGGPNETTARWALTLCGFVAALMVVDQVRFAFTRQAPDFWILFKGAREWARGGSLYDLEAVLSNHFGHVFKVPPFYAMLFEPFVFMDGERILLFHRLINVILIAATWLSLIWMARPAEPRRVMLPTLGGALVLLNFRPLYDTLSYGQIDLLLLFLLTLALLALQHRRDGLAGALVALGTLFKIYPVLLLAFFVVKGRWRALVGFTLGMLLCNGLAVLVMGWEMHRVYLTAVLPNIGGTTSWIESQTIASFAARWFETPTRAMIFADRRVAMVAMACSAALVLLASLLTLRPAPRRSPAYALQYGQFLLLMVLAVPAAWMHYETLLFLVFAALLWHYRDAPVSLPRATMLALSFALIGYGNQWSFYGGEVDGVLTLLGLSYKFFGMLVLGWLLTSAIVRATASPRLPERLNLALRRDGRGPTETRA